MKRLVLALGLVGLVLAVSGQVSIQSARTSRLGAAQIDYFKPSAFSWFLYRVAPNTTTGTPTVYTPDGSAFDVASLAPTGGTTYYISNSASNGYSSGSDSNNGTSKSTPFLSLSKALSVMVSGDTALINPGSYDKDFVGATTITGGKALAIKGDTGGTPILGAWARPTTLTWTLTSGATNTYQTTRSNTLSVWDSSIVDANGDYQRLTLAGSCPGTGDLTAGQFCISGTTVFVRTSDSRNLTVAGNNSTLRLSVTQQVIQATGANTIYLENLELQFNSAPLIIANNSATAATVYAKNVTLKYGGANAISGYNGATLTGTVSIFQNVTAAQNALDGLNYHVGTNSVLPQAIEINCLSRDNGWFASGDINNASTIHDGGSIVRVGGSYYRSAGPILADVDAGTTSWNIGVTAWGSTAATGAVQNANFQSQATGSGGMWIDASLGYRDPTAAAKYQFVVGASARMFVRMFSGDTNFSVGAGGTLSPY